MMLAAVHGKPRMEKDQRGVDAIYAIRQRMSKTCCCRTGSPDESRFNEKGAFCRGSRRLFPRAGSC